MVRLCLVLVSVILAILLCEAALRLLFPKYRTPAEGQMPPHDMRIYAPAPNTRDWWVHPDTRQRHPLHTNNLGLRQHRNFSAADIVSATTVGVFGDSFVNMPFLDAPYVFTEPLDYLLNLDGNFSVLNFGVNGYGPGQSYFTYRSFPARDALDYVLFAFFGKNDLRDLFHKRLFDLDEDGQLRQREVRGSAWWVPFASRLHLTYLTLDATGRLAPYVAGVAAQLQPRKRFRISFDPAMIDFSLEVFGQLMRRWSREVEASGGKFFVVFLPTQPDFPHVRPLLEEAGVGVVDLNACFEHKDKGHRGRDWRQSPYRFENDHHWNELGNRLAAACLDDRLRREAGLPDMARASRDAALAEYYAAFDPPSQSADLARSLRSRLEAIRRKYQTLGGLEAADPRILSPDDLAFDSNHYDVYFLGSRWLLFTMDDCHADNSSARPFAHPTPVDASILPRHMSYGPLTRRQHEEDEKGECIAMRRLPRFPLSHILVGQRERRPDVNRSLWPMLWSGEIFLDRAAFKAAMEGMLSAAGDPVIKSDMDVYIHGRRMFYVSDDCQRTDGRTPFFLHVAPDLPQARIEHGYANLDFHQVGVTVGERCVVRWQLPDYPIRHIRTGQYVKVADGGEPRLQRLWEGEASIGG